MVKVVFFDWLLLLTMWVRGTTPQENREEVELPLTDKGGPDQLQVFPAYFSFWCGIFILTFYSLLGCISVKYMVMSCIPMYVAICILAHSTHLYVSTVLLPRTLYNSLAVSTYSFYLLCCTSIYTSLGFTQYDRGIYCPCSSWPLWSLLLIL